MPKKLTYKPSANGKNSKSQTYWRVKKGLKVNGKPDWSPFGIDRNAALAFCEKLKLRDQLNGAVELEWLSSQNVNNIRWAHSKSAEVGAGIELLLEMLGQRIADLQTYILLCATACPLLTSPTNGRRDFNALPICRFKDQRD